MESTGALRVCPGRIWKISSFVIKGFICDSVCSSKNSRFLDLTSSSTNDEGDKNWDDYTDFSRSWVPPISLAPSWESHSFRSWRIDIQGVHPVLLCWMSWPEESPLDDVWCCWRGRSLPLQLRVVLGNEYWPLGSPGAGEVFLLGVNLWVRPQWGSYQAWRSRGQCVPVLVGELSFMLGWVEDVAMLCTEEKQWHFFE